MLFSIYFYDGALGPMAGPWKVAAILVFFVQQVRERNCRARPSPVAPMGRLTYEALAQ